MKRRKLLIIAIISTIASSTLACNDDSGFAPASGGNPIATDVIAPADRLTKIPPNAVKMSVESDGSPPIFHATDYKTPVPIPGEVNTAGAEDSPFIINDGHTLYFFFTPDVNVPVEKQILDGVTGIYVSKNVGGLWSKPERIILQDPGKISGEGCEFVRGDIMYFCTVREGYTGIHWFTAEYRNGGWQNWKIADFNPDYQVGELHITDDGTELYFSSDRPGGIGDLDIWVSKMIGGEWQEPINVAAVNTVASEGWPAIRPGGGELWFTRNNSIWRSTKVNEDWQKAELIVSPLAGEPSIDDAGNLYFVHHYFIDDKMVEADIYVAYKK